MPLDPHAQAIVDGAAGAPGLCEQTVDDARAQLGLFCSLAGGGEEVASVEDRLVPGPDGDIPVRVYTPASGSAPRGLLVWLHGGGWVLGDLDTSDTQARAMANGAGIVVVSVHYGLAPELPFPGPLDDAVAAL